MYDVLFMFIWFKTLYLVCYILKICKSRKKYLPLFASPCWFAAHRNMQYHCYYPNFVSNGAQNIYQSFYPRNSQVILKSQRYYMKTFMLYIMFQIVLEWTVPTKFMSCPLCRFKQVDHPWKSGIQLVRVKWQYSATAAYAFKCRPTYVIGERTSYCNYILSLSHTYTATATKIQNDRRGRRGVATRFCSWLATNRRLVADWSTTGRRPRGDLFAT